MPLRLETAMLFERVDRVTRVMVLCQKVRGALVPARQPPPGRRRTVTADTTLWRQRDATIARLDAKAGTLRQVEHEKALPAGALAGDLGLSAPDNRRTLTLEAVSDCVVYSLTAEEMALLYYQNPKLGFHVMRLIVARLMRDAQRHRPAVAPLPA